MTVPRAVGVLEQICEEAGKQNNSTHEDQPVDDQAGDPENSWSLHSGESSVKTTVIAEPENADEHQQKGEDIQDYGIRRRCGNGIGSQREGDHGTVANDCDHDVQRGPLAKARQEPSAGEPGGIDESFYGQMILIGQLLQVML